VVLSGSKRPIVGLTTYRQPAQTGVWNVEAAFLPAEYFDSVNRAGGTAVLLPPQELTAEAARELIAGLDALVVCGGRDVNPALYAHAPGEHTDEPDTMRDAFEMALLSAAIETNLPFLGICRGQQVLNVHQGGTLIQHLPDIVGSNKYQLGKGQFTMAEIEVNAGSVLSQALGGDAQVVGAVYHHQAIDQVGKDLRVVAKSQDDIVEAVELSGHGFGLAVQWHPEHTPEDNRIFEALVAAAAEHRSKR
jgi:putative glutamine amidotransferase